jgi:hypothetical protein
MFKPQMFRAVSKFGNPYHPCFKAMIVPYCTQSLQKKLFTVIEKTFLKIKVGIYTFWKFHIAIENGPK